MAHVWVHCNLMGLQTLALPNCLVNTLIMVTFPKQMKSSHMKLRKIKKYTQAPTKCRQAQCVNKRHVCRPFGSLYMNLKLSTCPDFCNCFFLWDFPSCKVSLGEYIGRSESVQESANLRLIHALSKCLWPQNKLAKSYYRRF